MLDVLSPVGDGRSWLEKIHQDYCGVQVKHTVLTELRCCENNTYADKFIFLQTAGCCLSASLCLLLICLFLSSFL